VWKSWEEWISDISDQISEGCEGGARSGAGLSNGCGKVEREGRRFTVDGLQLKVWRERGGKRSQKPHRL
jgi:hypothetical protein